jgi:hypothetical protein
LQCFFPGAEMGGKSRNYFETIFISFCETWILWIPVFETLKMKSVRCCWDETSLKAAATTGSKPFNKN